MASAKTLLFSITILLLDLDNAAAAADNDNACNTSKSTVAPSLLQIRSPQLISELSRIDTTSDSEEISTMMSDLFGSAESLHKIAYDWKMKNMHRAMESSGNAYNASISGDVNLWERLTRALVASDKAWPHESGLRRSLNLWSSEVANNITMGRGQRCGETGDGHFLIAHYSDICGTALSMDKFDETADVKLDLNLSPLEAPLDVRKAHGSLDLLVSHQVFEHLKRPSMGMANLNALLHQDGLLIFSTPFVMPDHNSPQDYFRYTVLNVKEFLTCSGFEVKSLRGLGNTLEALAYGLRIEADQLDDESIGAFCDGLVANDCDFKYYTVVAATAVKKRDTTVDEVHACFG